MATSRADAAVAALYRACHLSPPATITAATPNEFVNFVVMVRRPVLLVSALMIALAGAMIAIFSGAAFLTEPGFAILLLGFAFMATGLAAAARVAGKELPRIDWMVEGGTAVAAAVAIGVATVLVTGHARDAGLACAATLVVIFVLFAIQFANGGIPGRVGLMLRLGRWLPLYGAGPVNDIVARRLREAADELPRGSAEAVPAGPDQRDEHLASQLEHLMQRRLGLDHYRLAPILGQLAFRRRPTGLARATADAPLVLQSAAILDGSYAAAVLLDRVAVILLHQVSVPLPRPPATWQPRHRREPFVSVLAQLVLGPAWQVLVTLALGDRGAERLLAWRIVAEPDAALRLGAIQALGFARFFTASRVAAVDSGPEGTLYSVGPSAAPTGVLRVEDATAAPDGMPSIDWLLVAPHLASAREAVTWMLAKSGGKIPQVKTLSERMSKP